jgi:hypothetical protein
MNNYFLSTKHLFALIHTFLGKPTKQQLLLLEAAGYLIIARFKLSFLPTKNLIEQLKNCLCHDELYGIKRQSIIRETINAVESAANNMPGKMVCFPRAIAAQSMLQKRRIITTMYYGIARARETQISAHVWLQDGNNGIIGHTNSADYKVLFRCPDPMKYNQNPNKKEKHNEQET